MKTLRTLASFSLALLMVGCATKSDPLPLKAMPAPAQAEAVTPHADKVKADAVKGSEIAKRLEGKVELMEKTTAELRTGMSAATAEADRLRQQKVATEKELHDLWQLLTAADVHANRLFIEVEEAKAAAAEHKNHRLAAERRLDELAKAAQARDIETLELRAQRDHLALELDKAAQTHKLLQKKLTEAEMKGAVGQYLRRILMFVGVLIVIVLVVKLVSLFKPL